MSEKLDTLFAQYAGALAKAPKRRAGTRRNGEMTAEALAVKEAQRAQREAEARAALDAADRRAEDTYYRRVGRLTVLAKRGREARRLLAQAGPMVTLRHARLSRLVAALDRARDAVFALPILPGDLYQGGRFYRRAVWLGLKVGMTAADIEDIVSIACELSYVKGQTAQDDRGRTLPTIGAMYRNLKIAFHAEVERFRRNKSAGAVALYSLDAVRENMPADWWEAEEARMTYLGYGFDTRATDLDALYPPVMAPVSMAEESRAALQWAENRREAIRRLARMEAADRDALAVSAQAPEGVDRNTFEADRIAIRILINGGTVADVAKFTNNAESTVTARLLALEGLLGATRHSGPGSEPVHSTFDHSKREAYRHESFNASREGTRASEVIVSKR